MPLYNEINRTVKQNCNKIATVGRYFLDTQVRSAYTSHVEKQCLIKKTVQKCPDARLPRSLSSETYFSYVAATKDEGTPQTGVFEQPVGGVP